MNLVKKRKRIYAELNGYDETSFPGLVYFYDADLQGLSYSISSYLEKSLEAFYGRKFSIKTDEDLDSHAPEILNLPCVTPNGVILP